MRDSLVLLMPYAVEIRYPDDWFMPSAEDAVEANEAAQAVKNWLKQANPILFTPRKTKTGENEYDQN